jgi:hypothetical protein
MRALNLLAQNPESVLSNPFFAKKYAQLVALIYYNGRNISSLDDKYSLLKFVNLIINDLIGPQQ